MNRLKAEDSGLGEHFPPHDIKIPFLCQLHLYLQTGLSPKVELCTYSGLLDISTWKVNRHLKLDMATTELLILAASLQLKYVIP